MKAEHRHELKTNALAEWLGNFPQWARGNLVSIIIVLATIVAAGAFYTWRSYGKSARLQEQYRFTGLVNQISNRKMQILGGQAQETGSSSILFEPARNLAAFANSTDDDNLAAMALIKQAEALRTELHYRTETVSQQDLVAQIGRARQSYTDAVKKSSDNPSLAAAAKFGLGLCEEELGNFEGARRIYAEIADNAAFDGTVSVTQAKLRLETMDDYKRNVVFSPKPRPKPVRPPRPIKIRPADANSPPDANRPVVVIGSTDANAPAVTRQPVVDVNVPAQEPNKAAAKPQIKVVSVEPNVPTKAPEAKAPTVTVAPVVEPNSTPKTTEPNDPGM
ncbi:MAG: hypothetical protein ISS79_07645 [Phycisphaerae bacterium]|nr:hypothetical protein [Phycisphaerae bacterium]